VYACDARNGKAVCIESGTCPALPVDGC
jgi:hypothetical protein